MLLTEQKVAKSSQINAVCNTWRAIEGYLELESQAVNRAGGGKEQEEYMTDCCADTLIYRPWTWFSKTIGNQLQVPPMQALSLSTENSFHNVSPNSQWWGIEKVNTVPITIHSQMTTHDCLLLLLKKHQKSKWRFPPTLDMPSLLSNKVSPEKIQWNHACSHLL